MASDLVLGANYKSPGQNLQEGGAVQAHRSKEMCLCEEISQETRLRTGLFYPSPRRMGLLELEVRLMLLAIGQPNDEKAAGAGPRLFRLPLVDIGASRRIVRETTTGRCHRLFDCIQW